jgi:hypothetical protein
LIAVKTCLCMFQLEPVTISTHQRQLCVSCGIGKTCVSTSRYVDVCSDVSSQLKNDFLSEMIMQMKHGAVNMISKANDKVCNVNSRHPHDLRKLACRNHT